MSTGVPAVVPTPYPPGAALRLTTAASRLIGAVESFFTATHALWAEELVGPPSPHGALVTVPNRHTLLVHPILDLRVMSATNHMLELTRRMYAEGPGSISDGLFWLRDGTLTRLPHRVEEFFRA